MERKNDSFDGKSGTDRPGTSEGIGLPTQGSTRSSGDTGFGAQSPSSSGSSTGDRAAGGFGVTGASDFSSKSPSPGGLSGTSTESTASRVEFHECSHCGEKHVHGSDAQGFDKILTTVGLNERAIEKMRESLENLDFDSYFTQAKDYLSESATKAKTYAKDHKAVIGTALALVAVGAGVVIAANRKSNDQWVTPRIDDRDINRV